MPTTSVPARATRNSFLRRWRSSARQGSKLILGILVEAPQCKPARSEQGRCIASHALRLRGPGDLHLAERVADLCADTDAAADDVGDAGDVRAAAADQELVGLLAAAARR